MRVHGRIRALVAIVVSGVAVAFPSEAPGAANPRVRGNQLVDGPGRGHVVRLWGVNRSGLEYACIQGWGFFDSPQPDQIDDPRMIAAMKSWDINVVRVPANEDCWLGVNVTQRLGGKAYQQIVQRYVHALHQAGLYVILELHVAAPGHVKSQHLDPMPDRDHAPAFWRSVASTFKRDHALLFDLYNEPNHVGWGCWLRGCRIGAYDEGYGPKPAYRAVGMQQLVDAVRRTGARQPLMLGGLGYSHSLGGWIAHAPRDRLHQLVAAEHNYGGIRPCQTTCQNAIVSTRRRVPVVIAELGETDCVHGYVDRIMPFADAHGIGYLGWPGTRSEWAAGRVAAARP